MRDIIMTLLLLMILVTVNTLAHAGKPKTCKYQCNHIGQSKVKPFKHAKSVKKVEIAVAPMAQFRVYHSHGRYDY